MVPTRREFFRSTGKMLASGVGGALAASFAGVSVAQDAQETQLHGREHLLSSSGIAMEGAAFVDSAAQAGYSLEQIISQPGAIARELGFSEEEVAVSVGAIEAQIQQSDAAAEVAAFVDRVIVDGRFYNEWVFRPVDVARQLEFDLSNDAVSYILQSGMVGLLTCLGPNPDPGTTPDVVPRCDPQVCDPRAFGLPHIVIIIVIVLWSEPAQRYVTDMSSAHKY